MRNGLRTAASIAAFLAAVNGAASAQLTSSMTAADIVAALEAAGMAASMMEDLDSGAPVAKVEAGDVFYFVRAMDCSGGACGTLLFFANFALGRDAAPEDYSVVNSFNERQVFGRAYVVADRGEVGVDYVIELRGGVSKENVARNIDTWVDVVASFREHFRQKSTGF
ncbi:MAG: hypothetical protein GC152_00430 [Alphaproteobacteria bacterium]|nr:hypothetical protein [Alphaproteobacteria bacterium]